MHLTLFGILLRARSLVQVESFLELIRLHGLLGFARSTWCNFFISMSVFIVLGMGAFLGALLTLRLS